MGVSRIAGEVASTDRIDLKAKTATLVSLVAGMNLMLSPLTYFRFFPWTEGMFLVPCGKQFNVVSPSLPAVPIPVRLTRSSFCRLPML